MKRVIQRLAKLMPKRVAKEFVSRAPKAKRKKLAKPNPKRKAAKRRRGKNPADAAKALYEKFHGRPSTRATDHQVARHYHAHLAELGKLLWLVVKLPTGKSKLLFKGVTLASSEDGGQLYFVGGDQSIDLRRVGLAKDLPKDHVALGEAIQIGYHTKKGFHNFEPIDYFHKFGEEGGRRPVLHYDVNSKLLYLTGGSYQVRPEGIVN